MLEPPKIGVLATAQLAAWEKIADGWDGYEDGDQMRCGDCDQGMYRVMDDHQVAYHYSDGQRLAFVVAHLRQAHMNLDPDV